MPKYIKLLFITLISVSLFSCHSEKKSDDDQEGSAHTETPVTVTSITTGPMEEAVYLNATSSFMQKNYVKANANGYIQSVNAQVGKYVSAGQQLFTIKTKEAQSIGTTISKLDPTFKFTGVNKIVASGSGYVTQLNHQVGDYVQDGEQLAVISDNNSFAFILNLPFELRSYLQGKKDVTIVLPDSTKLDGVISGSMPSVDAATQTENIIIKTPSAAPLPENLIAKVKLVKTGKADAVSLPKSAILTNDEQSEFWVMKMISSNTAVKVPVEKGIETDKQVEILSPSFLASDRILVSGNYGLPDTANVKVTQ